MAGTSAKLTAMTRDAHYNKARSPDRISAQDGGTLFDLLQQARLYQKLDRQFKSELDPEMAAHCQVACLRNGRLLVLTPTPVWRTRLTLLSSALLSRLRNKGHPAMTGIDIKVSPLLSHDVPDKQPQELSAAARETLSRFAENCPDEKLRAIAKRMTD